MERENMCALGTSLCAQIRCSDPSLFIIGYTKMAFLSHWTHCLSVTLDTIEIQSSIKNIYRSTSAIILLLYTGYAILSTLHNIKSCFLTRNFDTELLQVLFRVTPLWPTFNIRHNNMPQLWEQKGVVYIAALINMLKHAHINLSQVRKY